MNPTKNMKIRTFSVSIFLATFVLFSTPSFSGPISKEQVIKTLQSRELLSDDLQDNAKTFREALKAGDEYSKKDSAFAETFQRELLHWYLTVPSAGKRGVAASLLGEARLQIAKSPISTANQALLDPKQFYGYVGALGLPVPNTDFRINVFNANDERPNFLRVIEIYGALSPTHPEVRDQFGAFFRALPTFKSVPASFKNWTYSDNSTLARASQEAWRAAIEILIEQPDLYWSLRDSVEPAFKTAFNHQKTLAEIVPEVGRNRQKDIPQDKAEFLSKIPLVAETATQSREKQAILLATTARLKLNEKEENELKTALIAAVTRTPGAHPPFLSRQLIDRYHLYDSIPLASVLTASNLNESENEFSRISYPSVTTNRILEAAMDNLTKDQFFQNLSPIFDFLGKNATTQGGDAFYDLGSILGLVDQFELTPEERQRVAQKGEETIIKVLRDGRYKNGDYINPYVATFFAKYPPRDPNSADVLYRVLAAVRPVRGDAHNWGITPDDIERLDKQLASSILKLDKDNFIQLMDTLTEGRGEYLHQKRVLGAIARKINTLDFTPEEQSHLFQRVRRDFTEQIRQFGLISEVGGYDGDYWKPNRDRWQHQAQVVLGREPENEEVSKAIQKMASWGDGTLPQLQSSAAKCLQELEKLSKKSSRP